MAKVLLITLPNSVDISGLALGEAAQVSIGTSTVSGVLDIKMEVVDPPSAEVPAHTHLIAGTVAGTTGQPE